MQVDTRRGRAVPAVTVALALLVVAGLTDSGSVSAATTSRTLYYAFNPTPAPGSSRGTLLTNDGTARVSTSLVTASGGRLTAVDSRPGQGKAARFPRFDPSRPGARAVVKIVNRASTDVLAPGRRDFSWSAAFKVDAASAKHSRTSHDNGDNIFQRGLYDRSQFKLDVDDHRPGCRLRGSTGTAGAVRVVAPMTVSSTRWYRATCTRSGNRLTATVALFGANGAVRRTWRRSATSKVGFGSVTWKDIGTPVTIGGKLTAGSRLTPGSSDQFNGVVDNPQLRIRNP